CRVWGLQGESVYRYYVILTISIRIMLIVSLLPMPVVQVSNLPHGSLRQAVGSTGSPTACRSAAEPQGKPWRLCVFAWL
ncbi:MAG: hypothetical protein ROW48_00005, partial [Bellilinea sp.]